MLPRCRLVLRRDHSHRAMLGTNVGRIANPSECHGPFPLGEGLPTPPDCVTGGLRRPAPVPTADGPRNPRLAIISGDLAVRHSGGVGRPAPNAALRPGRETRAERSRTPAGSVDPRRTQAAPRRGRDPHRTLSAAGRIANPPTI